MKKQSTVLFLVLILIIALLSGCARRNGVNKNGDLTIISMIVTTTQPPVELEGFNASSDRYHWYFNDSIKSTSIELDESLYEQYKSRQHDFVYSGSLQEDWEHSYYMMFVNTSEDEASIRQLIVNLNQIAGSDFNVRVENAVGFVQGIPYEYNRLSVQNGTPKYPYETLYEYKGVCGDKAPLLAKILMRMGYGVALLNYETQKHIAVGIRCPKEYADFNSSYCFIETTEYVDIGYIPKQYATGIIIRDWTPEIIKLSDGMEFTGMSAIRQREKQLIENYGNDILDMGAEAKVLYIELKRLELLMNETCDTYRSENCEGIVPSGRYEHCLNAYNQ